MTLYEHKLSFLLLEEYFGPIVASVCQDLKWGPKPLKLLSTSVKLPLATVKQALSILINFNFVGYKTAVAGATCEYFLLSNNIVLLLRYPKFLLIMRKKYGKDAEYALRELLFSGHMKLYSLILRVAFSLSQEPTDIPFSLTMIKDTVYELINNGFLIPVERVTDAIVPVPIQLTEIEKIPTIDMTKLSNLCKGTDTEFPRNELYWRVNFERFLLENRNEILISAVNRRFSSSCGVVMEHLLKLSSAKSDLWRAVSNPVPMMLLRDSIGKDVKNSGILLRLKQFIDEMEEDSCSFIGRSADQSNSTLVCFKDAIFTLALECVNQILNLKFGPKHARVFTIIRLKKYIELEQIPRTALLADKEAKNITYKLLEENFIRMQELRKPNAGFAGSTGPNKSYILFCVDCNSVMKMISGMAYKNVYNITVRLREELNKHNHIFEKKKQAEMLTHSLREQQATESEISEMVNSILSPPEMELIKSLQKVIKKMRLTQIQVDETILLMQLHSHYHKKAAPASKLKRKR